MRKLPSENTNNGTGEELERVRKKTLRALTGQNRLPVELMRIVQPSLKGSVLEALMNKNIEESAPNLMSVVDRVKPGSVVRVVGAVYSETRRRPKKARVQEDHHSCRSWVESEEHCSQDKIEVKCAIVIGLRRGNW